MNSNRNFYYFINNLREKHRLSLRNQHNDDEVWYMYISPLNAFSGFMALVMVLFIIILTTVAYTSILDLIPGYPGNKSRELLISNIMRLDSMERELTDLQVYSDNVALIMDGKTPTMRTVSQGADTSLLKKMDIVKPTIEDSLLRLEIESGGLYRLNESATSSKGSRSNMGLIAPINGIVASHFSPKQSRYGVGVATAASQQVVAVEDGTITLSLWTPEDGYVMQVQHASNLISVYRHSTQSLKSVGSRVKAGEVIGYTGEGLSGDTGKGLFEFELWHNGTPVDPEGYIVF